MISFDVKLDRNGFSLDVAGEFSDGITAIFGPSGAGKSSLLSCLAGSIRPTSGYVDLDEHTLYSSEQKIWVPTEKRRIGTVYQDGALFPHLNVRRNIEFGWKLLDPADRRLVPLDIAEFLGLGHLLDRKPNELSGGERQRVAIARALATSPQLLLLDEPLASLDAARRGSILNYLKRVHAEFGIPMVYVSHSISEVVSIASKAMLLRDGKVEGFDRPSALLLRAAAAGGDIDSFENILDGVIGESTDQLTTVKIGEVEISTRHQNKNPGETVVVSLGANQIILAADRPTNISARNIFGGRVSEVWSKQGKVFAEVDAGEKFIVELTENALNELGISVGSDVFLVFKSSSVEVFDA
ncbi:molybdenum ABC transporter ATP-binding protein [Candidatus Lucifugimonas marina]|uniref:Molybdenum ABC transporter ATP-binding protein n=1 Tax=Candidatus Lucifugimonas marina TaxID=3038979 RepID=A0AAJ5ZIB3_9CHLR|nr:molybdenum ABC transporter ATP-binding protein [SAR202 cluster bacterium JH702]MDG0870482.1 molybdenum ABC transporter ATP-binding protein [SAR202 cluster bacterium JH639]WFG35971.1 molybdenum ABC transporter ATP-binding protein [SAR202 cluster bacterium JH545]WFG39915.1 molybdenum ABC transporter ATP-binding protein [SAR202 cluster bacterium JH1073]